jgi:hypothetical protein
LARRKDGNALTNDQVITSETGSVLDQRSRVFRHWLRARTSLLAMLKSFSGDLMAVAQQKIYG